MKKGDDLFLEIRDALESPQTLVVTMIARPDCACKADDHECNGSISLRVIANTENKALVLETLAHALDHGMQETMEAFKDKLLASKNGAPRIWLPEARDA
jgi:hypothetical protein